jgi:hypothetical protein
MAKPTASGTSLATRNGVTPQLTEEQARFLPALLGVVVPALVSAIPAAIQAIQGSQRGLPEQAQEPEPDAEAVERGFGALLGSLIPVALELGPTIIDMIQGRRAGPGESEDDEEMVRSLLPDLISGCIPPLLSHLPDIIQSFLGQANPVGAQPKASDREVGTRFFGPLASVFVNTLATTLPQLISVIAPRPTKAAPETREVPTPRGWFQLVGINWESLLNGEGQEDSDVILAVQTPGNPDTADFRVELPPHKDWGKALQFLDRDGNQFAYAYVGGRTKVSDTVSVPKQYVDSDYNLVFQKAKLFGVMTGMYHLTDLRPGLGKVTVFRWLAE